MRKFLAVLTALAIAGVADAGVFGHRGGGCAGGSCGSVQPLQAPRVAQAPAQAPVVRAVPMQVGACAVPMQAGACASGSCASGSCASGGHHGFHLFGRRHR